ncbi:glycoside hydrolase [Suillus bovinus]|uniref:glycoside hydrolase n=1 Tax=Suillus bovinus TaxID=48563 RepID=UPI001B8809BD|nr:glycoside hydrolase [Suillus bovinus]KAG2131990.1 glycoside hydrolase [Suillus bovinus]
MQDQGKYSVGYSFVNWGIYDRKFPPSLIPVQDLTPSSHILYAFADLKADTGEVVLSDPWADKDIHYPGDSWNEIGNNLYGNFKALYKLKQQNRHLKVLLSIGGWTYSTKFHPIVVDPALRANFVRSAVRLLEDYGLDGLDVDYEYPSNEHQARGYTDLLRELRVGLDQHAQMKEIDHRFLLTIAAPCGPDHYQKLHVREMDHYLDFWNMMAYDFSGSWDSVANHQANIYGGAINASQAIEWYSANGVPRSKMVLGIPLYGRSFLNTSGPGAPFSGTGPGTWEQGVYDYRVLPLPGADVFEDENALASWSYDDQKQEIVSFDDEQVGQWKGDWICREGLQGSMFWELSGDKGSEREGMEGGIGKDPVPGRSLVEVVKNAMGPLDLSPNWLSYEDSQFDNLSSGTI